MDTGESENNGSPWQHKAFANIASVAENSPVPARILGRVKDKSSHDGDRKCLRRKVTAMF